MKDQISEIEQARIDISKHVIDVIYGRWSHAKPKLIPQTNSRDTHVEIIYSADIGSLNVYERQKYEDDIRKAYRRRLNSSPRLSDLEFEIKVWAECERVEIQIQLLGCLEDWRITKLKIKPQRTKQ